VNGYVIWVLFLIFSGNAHARFRALLVGINYHNAAPEIRRLSGAVNDVHDMYALMTTSLGIPSSSIRVLVEKQATRQAIVDTFRKWFIEGTEAGDVIFFQYSGHGVQVPDVSGSQKLDPVKKGKIDQQALAEAFVPYDIVVDMENKALHNLIVDSEFHMLLKELKGRDVNLFLDLCHSGGVTKDFPQTNTPTRNLKLPWEVWQTTVVPPDGLSKPSTEGTVRRVRLNKWFPDYTCFAAVKHFQSAYEYPPLYQGKNGAFTYAVLKLLKSNPQALYTNKQVLDYARKYVSQVIGIPKSFQEPVLYGPRGSRDKTFVLLTQRSSSTAVNTHPPSSSYAQEDKTAVFITGLEGEIKSRLQRAVKECDYARIVTRHPDVIMEVKTNSVDMYNAVGKRLKSISTGNSVIAQVMEALTGLHIVRRLAVVENPAAPFAVELWIDEPGKSSFKTSDRVTVYYRVNGLAPGEKTYLTLINVAPDGTMSILYPQKDDFYRGIGQKLFLNSLVEPGKIYSIPKTGTALRPGQNVAVDLRIRLAEGQEYFKAIVTSEQIDWESMDLGEFRSHFKGKEGRSFAVEAGEKVRTSVSWAATSLTVEVKK